jgi:uncharacterized protein (DUF2126 family)/transglutaminase-like putative cysteine protease
MLTCCRHRHASAAGLTFALCFPVKLQRETAEDGDPIDAGCSTSRSETSLSLHVALNHVTHYQYDRPVTLGPQVVRLRPAPHSRSRVLSYSLKVEPAEHFINWQQDPFANYQARLVFPSLMRELKVTVDLIVEMAVFNPFDFFLEPSAETFPFRYSDAQQRELAPYLAAMPATPLFANYLSKIDLTGQPTIGFLMGLNRKLQSSIQYSIRMEPGVQTPEDTLRLAWGSCRDTGWLMVQLLRHLGLAARFVSGYLIQLKADVKSLDGPSGTDVDFTDLHAWCEVFLPGAGWVGLDPTSGLMAGEGHIPLACTPEPSSAAPIEGAVDHSEVTFAHHMRVDRIVETARVTQPYTNQQWSDILVLGDKVDADLSAGDVRLTMGGEPTFVATSDRDAAEWNIDALGPTKRDYATQLVHKLKAEYGEGGFLHFGQGKWYPGEQLPRWALSLFWRVDGKPLWHDATLFADERVRGTYTAADAERFIHTLAGQLALQTSHIRPGFEDTFYYLWRERQLPVNVDPMRSQLDEPLERERLARIFSQGLDVPVGYVLPLRVRALDAAASGPPFASGPWFFRDGRMYLLPGDSPMGYRLPLDSLPWVDKNERNFLLEADPFEQRNALPTDDETASGKSAALADAAQEEAESRSPKAQESAPWLPRVALCVEVRSAPSSPSSPAKPTDDTHKSQTAESARKHGGLYVFMPPLERLEDYLRILRAVEVTAAQLGMRITLEGYPPPRDPRLKMLQVTPDPGVIEVNIHPASNWRDMVAHTEFLYRIAHETRLSAEKFMTDGRHTGTGGGNHFVMGGATPADSPFLRRPELLGSLLAYWHNHPSLSYLFSGLFIGPTSQAPRLDEARNDQLYELEIALQQIYSAREKFGGGDGRSAGPPQARPAPPEGRESHEVDERGGYIPPWLIDRTLRNILVDVTGNTHRSEFCIDKLYSPDSSTGRLGLLELRAFEMPPHARMSIAQQLLLRALVAHFWNKPYHPRLTRWGTALHDRFLLPSVLKSDFADVLADLGDAGYAFDSGWFEPHFEFRFPLIGQISAGGVELTLRTALEPWHVMGEESAGGGTVRYVDSSLERIEVKVSGWNGERHVVTVNGRALPLQSTGRAGEFVAGVRYKAWNPPSALHPSIGVQAPLVFDVVDTWAGRSLGGCEYHVVHPGGRNYDTLPVNSYEAESRRLARFVRMGHTPGKMNVQPAQPAPEFPFTLDLRHQHA